MPILLRRYEQSDAAATLDVFFRAVRVTAASYYSSEQIAVWAPEGVDLREWASRQNTRNAVVAEIDGELAGFSDVDEQGYIDMMYVAPEHGRKGVATALLGWVKTEAARLGAERLTTHASEAARAFFEQQGFTVDAPRSLLRGGVVITNYAMSMHLGHSH
jgi:putative acetyltransferase